MQITIIHTPTANLASVMAAFRRLKATPRIVTHPDQLEPRDVVVLPGVGAFAAGIGAVRQAGWDRVLTERFADDQPTLAICLGLQLLCRSSAEHPDVRGLGILPTDVRRLPDDVTVPHFGWNRMTSTSDFFADGFVYYANSYCATGGEALTRAGWELAETTHGIRFVAAARRGTWLACQFHPELSGAFGQRLLSRWLEASAQRIEALPPITERSSC